MKQAGDSVLNRYLAILDQRGFTADAAQLAAARRLDRLAVELVAFRDARRNRLRRMLKPPATPRGAWMYGGVGRGKSFLMDCFFNAVPIRRKTRVHFHEFMRGVHRELNDLRGQADPLKVVAGRISKRYRLICFDEFHVSDIADAMILERLLTPLFDAGTCFVMTSNYEPSGLYPDGLHRDRLVPVINRLNQELDMVRVDTGVDYRQMSLAGVKAYHWPDDQAARTALSEAFNAVAEVGDEEPMLTIEHREIAAVRRAGGVVWFDFETLCLGPRSQNDYLEIAQQFHTVFLTGVPSMKPAMASAARRFLWLIDVLYDQRVTLFVSAQCPPDELYTEGPMVNEFQRTESRLVEMQSTEYLTAPRRGIAERLS
ncbi:MAG: cell division protein ZapE [Burkholderiaceae bacterium]